MALYTWHLSDTNAGRVGAAGVSDDRSTALAEAVDALRQESRAITAMVWSVELALTSRAPEFRYIASVGWAVRDERGHIEFGSVDGTRGATE